MGLQRFCVGVERRDILRRYTSAARLGVIGETQVAALAAPAGALEEPKLCPGRGA